MIYHHTWYHDITKCRELGGSVCVLCHASDNDGCWTITLARAWPLSTCKYRSGCRFFKWLWRLEVFPSMASTSCRHTRHFGRSGGRFESKMLPNRSDGFSFSSYSSISGLVSSLLALAGLTDTGLSLIARPATCISNSSIKSSQSNNGIATRIPSISVSITISCTTLHKAISSHSQYQ